MSTSTLPPSKMDFDMLNREAFSTYNFNARYTQSQCVNLYSPITMQPSYSCLALMRSYEKLYRMPYWDQNGKLINEYVRGATIGYGHLIKNASEFEKFKNGVTDTQANTLFNDDLYNFIYAVRHLVTEKLTQHEFDALLMFAFNIGVSGFKTSRVLKIINGIQVGNLKKEWQSYRYSHGKVMSGLIHRRGAEMNVFFNGVYFKK